MSHDHGCRMIVQLQGLVVGRKTGLQAGLGGRPATGTGLPFLDCYSDNAAVFLLSPSDRNKGVSVKRARFEFYFWFSSLTLFINDDLIQSSFSGLTHNTK